MARTKGKQAEPEAAQPEEPVAEEQTLFTGGAAGTATAPEPEAQENGTEQVDAEFVTPEQAPPPEGPEPEVGLSADQRMALRSPGLGGNVVGLSMIPDRARDILQARIDILRTLRTASIKATFATDWLKFYNKDTGQEMAYLQDSGCERVIKLWNIVSIDGVPPVPEKFSADGQFQWVFRGSAKSEMTGEQALDIEGTRYSDDPFFKGTTGLRLDYLVKKSARANWDGNVLRTLSGLGNVPVEELAACGLNTEKCHKGRGYDRTPEGANVTVKSAGIPESEYPTCSKCGGPTKFIPGRDDAEKKYDAFFACKKPKGECGGRGIGHAEWLKKIGKGAAPAPAQSGAAESGWLCENSRRIAITNMRKTLHEKHKISVEELNQDLVDLFQQPEATPEKLTNEQASTYISHLATLVNNRA